MKLIGSKNTYCWSWTANLWQSGKRWHCLMQTLCTMNQAMAICTTTWAGRTCATHCRYWRKQRAALKMAIKFDGPVSGTFIHMGNLMIRCNRYTEAITYLEQGVRNHQQVSCFGRRWVGRMVAKATWKRTIKSYKETMMASVVDHRDHQHWPNHVARCRKEKMNKNFWKVLNWELYCRLMEGFGNYELPRCKFKSCPYNSHIWRLS